MSYCELHKVTMRMSEIESDGETSTIDLFDIMAHLTLEQVAMIFNRYADDLWPIMPFYELDAEVEFFREKGGIIMLHRPAPLDIVQHYRKMDPGLKRRMIKVAKHNEQVDASGDG
jgi:hypothetical protein